MSKLVAALIAATFSLGAFAADTPAAPTAPVVKEMKKATPATSTKKHHHMKKAKKAPAKVEKAA